MQSSRSSHGAWLFAFTQPVPGRHASSVHGFPSSHIGGAPPTQVPFEHASAVVHAFPSLHGAVLFAWTQPEATSHESFVHGFPSSQLSGGPPTQAPCAQASPVVQAFPSLHGAVLFAFTHPDAGSHESFVHAFPSLQFGAAPPTQTPAEQVSPVVHAFPSLHDPATFTCLQPVDVTQESVVHTFASSQFVGPPLAHDPFEHWSPVVHAFPSLHGAVLFRWRQPEEGLHRSSVQILLSSQSGAGPPTHTPPAQRSDVVQALPSLHVLVLFAFTQPVVVLHESSVHGFESLQLIVVPALHDPPLHRSPVVQAFPSSHASVLFACAQPEAGTQLSVVQRFPSSQFGGGPPTHTPPEQASPVVHAFASLHERVLFAFTQPVAGLHESVVHTLPSLQFGAAPPTHTPAEQASFVVHAFPSLHDPATFTCLQPVAGTQESVVQTFASSQFAAAPPTHAPFEQASFVVHAFASLHETVLFACTQPVAGEHESSVHTLLSLQFGAAPPTQTPAEQASPVVHAFPSLHDPVMFA